MTSFSRSIRSIVLLVSLLAVSAQAWGQEPELETPPAMPQYLEPDAADHGDDYGPEGSFHDDFQTPIGGYGAGGQDFVAGGQDDWCCECLDGSGAGPLASWLLTGWRFEVLAAPIRRDIQRDFILASVAGEQVLSTDDLDFEFQAGVRALIGRRIDDRYSVDFVYTDVDPWTDFVGVRNVEANNQGAAGVIESFLTSAAPGAAPPNTDFDNNTLATLENRSIYRSGEINLRQKIPAAWSICTFDMIYGARYARIGDQIEYFTASSVGGGATNRLNVNTRNKMAGFQLGMAMHYQCNPWAWIDFEMKGAVLQNRARQQTVYTTTPDPVSVFTGRRSEGRTSYMGDLTLLFEVYLVPQVWLSLGYQATWYTGLALAEANLEENVAILRAGPTGLDHRGQAVYHGPRIGIGAAW